MSEDELNNSAFRMGTFEPVITIITAAMFCAAVVAQNSSKPILIRGKFPLKYIESGLAN